MHNRFFGAVHSPVDHRDYQFGDIPGAASPLLPYHSDVEDIIVNQEDSSQCGPCAITAARYETEYLQNGNTRLFSHTYVYGMDNDFDEEGMYLRTLMNIAKAGIPYITSWESWGDKTECRKLVKKHTTPELQEEAHRLRGTKYYSCKTWEEVCNAARVTNGSVIIMVGIYSNWFSGRKDGVIGVNKGAYMGNHFLRVKDYDIMENGVLRIRCQNSWGTEWGKNGYCYLFSNKNKFIEAMCLVDDLDEVVNKLTFSDVTQDRWSAEAIEWCSDNGILTGFEDGTFRPSEPMTREQVASMLYRFSQKISV